MASKKASPAPAGQLSIQEAEAITVPQGEGEAIQAEIVDPMIITREMQVKSIIQRLMAQEDHLSFTSLYNFSRSPVHFIDYKLGKVEEEETAAMKYGSMLHCLVLEPHLFEERYFCFDDSEKVQQMKDKGASKPRATKEYKEWAILQTQGAGDRTIVSPQEYRHAKLVAMNVQHNRAAYKIMKMCPQHEVKISWEHKNFKFKGFIDGKGPRVRFDLKSMADAQKRKAQRTIVDRLQYIQAAMYQFGDDGIGDDHYIIGVDKMSGVSTHQLHPALLDQGMRDYEALIDNFNHCVLKEQFDQSFDFWAERWDGVYSCEKLGWMAVIARS